jgi:hypothetical protein
MASKKSISVKVDGVSFDLAVDPDDIIEQTIDQNKFFPSFLKDGKDGAKEVDLEKFAETAAFAKDPAAYKRALRDAVKTSIIEELEKEAVAAGEGGGIGKKAGDTIDPLLKAFLDKKAARK